MDESSPRWTRAARLDADRLVVEILARTGLRYAVEGPCPGGEVGAAYVRGPGGRRSVLTWRPDVLLADVHRGPLAVVEALCAAGYPAPDTELALQVGADVVTVQRLLPGSTPARVGHRLLDRLLELNARQAGVLAARPDVPALRLHLREDGPGFCLHEPLRHYGHRGTALERWVREVGAEHPGDGLPGDDAVHMDFQPGNVLVLGDDVTGVVDWDGGCRGDRRFDLVTLRFCLSACPAEPGVAGRLDEILDAMPPEVLRPAWAHMSLRMADWCVRHHPPDVVEHWLDVAEERTRLR